MKVHQRGLTDTTIPFIVHPEYSGNEAGFALHCHGLQTIAGSGWVFRRDCAGGTVI